MAALKQNYDRRETCWSLRWQQLMLSLLLILTGAFCLLKYMGWAWVVSGLYGLPSQAHTAVVARHWSLVYLWVGLLAEVVLVVNLAIRLKLDNIDLAGVPKLLARGIAALAMGEKGGQPESVSERTSESSPKRLVARGGIAPARTREHGPESSYGDWSEELANRPTAASHMREEMIWMRT